MWEKLKHEWKTAAFAVAAFAVGVWDMGASTLDYTPIFPDKYKPFAQIGIPLLFLILRRWAPRRES